MSVARPAPLLLGIRLLRMLWRMLPPLLLAGNLLAAAYLLKASEALKSQAVVVAQFIVGFALLLALIREILSPQREQMRLVAVSDYRAQRLVAVAKALATVLFGTELLIYLAEANGWNPIVASLLALLRNVGLLVFGWSAINRSGLLKRFAPATVETNGEVVRWMLARVVAPFAFLVALFFVIVHSLGYEALSRWVVNKAGWTALVVVLAVLLYRWSRGRLKRTVAFLQADDSASAEEDAKAEHREASEPAPIWIGVERILAGALKIGFYVGIFFVLLNTWELTLDGVRGFLDAPIIGAWALTWGQLVKAFLSVAITLIVGLFLQNVLIFIVFPRAGSEVGVRYATLAILKYVTWIIALLLALSAFGFDTSTFAVFAGAFGLGLSFGLQDIFANFFAGLIMLLEQPVRVGDTIEVGGASGRVEAIKLRGTTIRTFDNTTIMIPNRQMIGERLSNLTYDMNFARVQINVGVSYGADPRVVQDLLLKLARGEPRILHDPEPFVRFTGFGESSIDFSLRCYTSDTGGRWGLASDLRTLVFEELREAGIEIPFPQRDLHIRTSIAPEHGPLGTTADPSPETARD